MKVTEPVGVPEVPVTVAVSCAEVPETVGAVPNESDGELGGADTVGGLTAITVKVSADPLTEL